MCFVCVWLASASGLDVNWLPADADGPLPLSMAYRENLRKLCDATRNGLSSPDTISNTDQQKIQTLCKKLKEFPSGLDEPSEQAKGSTNKLGYLAAVAAVAAGVFYFTRIRLGGQRISSGGSGIGGFASGITGRADSSLNNEELRKARAARFST